MTTQLASLQQRWEKLYGEFADVLNQSADQMDRNYSLSPHLTIDEKVKVIFQRQVDRTSGIHIKDPLPSLRDFRDAVMKEHLDFFGRDACPIAFGRAQLDENPMFVLMGSDNLSDIDRQNLLLSAAGNGYLSVVRQFKTIDQYDKTLIAAAKNGRLSILEDLLYETFSLEGVQWAPSQEILQKALVVSSERGYVDVVKLLLPLVWQGSLDVPFIAAARSMHQDVMEVFLAQGVSDDAKKMLYLFLYSQIGCLLLRFFFIMEFPMTVWSQLLKGLNW